MSKNKEIMLLKNIQGKIYTFRGVQVMLDSDLAEIYGVENKRLNEQVKRNIDGSLTLKSQIATSSSSSHGGRRTLPYVFTEQGVSMLSAVLKSEAAIKVSIQIMDREIILQSLFSRADTGLLKGDSSPTMPDGLLGQIVKNIGGY